MPEEQQRVEENHQLFIDDMNAADSPAQKNSENSKKKSGETGRCISRTIHQKNFPAKRFYKTILRTAFHTHEINAGPGCMQAFDFLVDAHIAAIIGTDKQNVLLFFTVLRHHARNLPNSGQP
jgi:hypothetical protein